MGTAYERQKLSLFYSLPLTYPISNRCPLTAWLTERVISSSVGPADIRIRDLLHHNQAPYSLYHAPVSVEFKDVRCLRHTCFFIYFSCIGVGRFRILGGQALEYWGGGQGGGGANSQQAHEIVMTSMRRHVPTRFLIHQCLITTFLNLKIQ